ncbi:MAG TPA: hypothetical protein VNF04_02045 [Stellaceae bacterium]|nr:hypothetical protein [Stellaceae bacterium]
MRSMRVWISLFICLAVAACAAENHAADQDRHDGFYGGVSGGLTRP